MKKLIIFLTLIICYISLASFAPPGDPGGAPGAGDPPVGDPPVGAPIDGGAIALLVAGAAYGVKQMKNKKK